jgi:hypothetical protein
VTAICRSAPRIAMSRTSQIADQKCSPTPNIRRMTPSSASWWMDASSAWNPAERADHRPRDTPRWSRVQAPRDEAADQGGGERRRC